MLIIEENSVYEIDEECVKKRGVSIECGVIEKVEEYEKRKRTKEKLLQDKKNKR